MKDTKWLRSGWNWVTLSAGVMCVGAVALEAALVGLGAAAIQVYGSNTLAGWLLVAGEKVRRNVCPARGDSQRCDSMGCSKRLEEVALRVSAMCPRVLPPSQCIYLYPTRNYVHSRYHKDRISRFL